jgi:hypothetical protein
VLVEADVFADGHDQVACQILYWQNMKELQTSLMKPLGNDRWRDEFSVEMLRRYQYTVEGRIVFALALAVGLGSKKFVTKSLERDTKKVSSDTVEDPLRHL